MPWDAARGIWCATRSDSQAFIAKQEFSRKDLYKGDLLLTIETKPVNLRKRFLSAFTDYCNFRAPLPLWTSPSALVWGRCGRCPSGACMMFGFCVFPSASTCSMLRERVALGSLSGQQAVLTRQVRTSVQRNRAVNSAHSPAQTCFRVCAQGCPFTAECRVQQRRSSRTGTRRVQSTICNSSTKQSTKMQSPWTVTITPFAWQALCWKMSKSALAVTPSGLSLPSVRTTGTTRSSS